MFSLLRQVITGEISLRQAFLALGHFLSFKRWRTGDDFNWDRYHLHYQEELTSIGRRAKLVLNPSDIMPSENGLVTWSKQDLLPGHQLLYEAVYSFKPNSVLEIGCGGGDHLANIRSIMGDQVELSGLDRSQHQLQIARNRHPNLGAKLLQCDVTADAPHCEAELVYSHAVLMHISENDGRFRSALTFALKSATQGLILIENWSQHDFVGELKVALQELNLDWQIGYIALEGKNSPKAVLVSPTDRWPSGVRELVSIQQLLGS